jgi:hypothetical protein
MAQADRGSGKDLHLSYTPLSGSAIDLDVDYRSFSYEQSLNEIDATAGDDDWEYMLDSFKRGNIPITVLAGNEDVDDIVVGQTGSLIVGRRGSTNGMRKVTIPVKVMSINEGSEYADVQTLDITFRQTGNAVVATFSA